MKDIKVTKIVTISLLALVVAIVSFGVVGFIAVSLDEHYLRQVAR